MENLVPKIVIFFLITCCFWVVFIDKFMDDINLLQKIYYKLIYHRYTVGYYSDDYWLGHYLSTNFNILKKFRNIKKVNKYIEKDFKYTIYLLDDKTNKKTRIK